LALIAPITCSGDSAASASRKRAPAEKGEAVMRQSRLKYGKERKHHAKLQAVDFTGMTGMQQ
jgi:hypothetical protein